MHAECSTFNIPDMVNKGKVRQEVVAKAGALFRKQGYFQTTMNDIARAVGKGKSSLYYYYSSKEEILKNVVLLEAVAFRQAMIAAIGQVDDPREKLKFYVLTRMQTLQEYNNFYMAMSDERMERIPFVKKLHNIYLKEEIRLFRNILKAGVDKTYFRIGDIWLAAAAMVMAMKGMEEQLFIIRDREAFANRLEDIINIMFYGIVPR